MTFYNSPRKLLSMLLFNILLIGSLSPSFASEVKTGAPTQKLSNRYRLSSISIKESDRTDNAALLTRTEFLQSAQPFFEQLRQHFETEYAILDSSARLHNNSVVYLAEQLDRLTAETEQLFTEMQSAQQKSSSTNDLSFTMTKQQENSDGEVQSALEELQRSLGIDLSAADGTFNPGQPLTRGEYFRYLQQIDRKLAEFQYGENARVNSVLSADPVQAVTEFNDMNRLLRDILADIAEVQSLTSQLRRELNNRTTADSKTNSRVSYSANKPKRNVLRLSQVDETNDTEQVVTHGDFAVYVISQITEILSSDNSFVRQERLMFTVSHYAAISGQLELMSSDLKAAIAQLN